jgi:hypothetical protein
MLNDENEKKIKIKKVKRLKSTRASMKNLQPKFMTGPTS